MFFFFLPFLKKGERERRGVLPSSPPPIFHRQLHNLLSLARAARRASARVRDGPAVFGQRAPRRLRELDAAGDRGPRVPAAAKHRRRQRRRDAVAGAPVGGELPQLRAAGGRGLVLRELALCGVDRRAVGVGVFGGVRLERVLEAAAGARPELGAEERAGDGVGCGVLVGFVHFVLDVRDRVRKKGPRASIVGKEREQRERESGKTGKKKKRTRKKRQEGTGEDGGDDDDVDGAQKEPPPVSLDVVVVVHQKNASEGRKKRYLLFRAN